MLSNASASGPASRALLAVRPSPENPEESRAPAIVEMRAALTSRTRRPLFVNQWTAIVTNGVGAPGADMAIGTASPLIPVGTVTLIWTAPFTKPGADPA